MATAMVMNWAGPTVLSGERQSPIARAAPHNLKLMKLGTLDEQSAQLSKMQFGLHL